MPPTEEPAALLWNATNYPFWAGMAFLFGLLWGSFLNVAIYRWPFAMTTSRPRRSFCFRCGTGIEPQDNIPVLSWALLLRGRCRSCGSPISPRYALVEMLTGLLFLGVFLLHNSPDSPSFQVATIWYMIFAAALVISTFTDIDHWIIPDRITLGGTALALGAAVVIGIVDRQCMLTDHGVFPALRVTWNEDIYLKVEALLMGRESFVLRDVMPQWWEAPANALIGAGVGSFVLYGVGVVGKLIFRKEAMGMGDVKLFALIGATFGVVPTVLILFIASAIGMVLGIVPMILNRIRGGAVTPLALGDPGPDGMEQLTDPRLRELLTANRLEARRPVGLHHIPFGPSIAVAAVLYLLFHAAIWDFLVTMIGT